MSTIMYSGLNGEKPSSRVRAPPGGRSNNIFGNDEVDDSANKAPKKENIRPISNIFGEQAPSTDKTPKKLPSGGSSDNVKSILFGNDATQQQVNVAATKKKRVGINPITGRRYEEEDEDEQKKPDASNTEVKEEKPAAGVHTSSKVSQPPGGRSTKLW